MISLYSLIWTVLISCPLLLLIVVLRRRTACLMKYGVTFICILYAFCAIRMLIPIEVPVFQKVICDPHMFSFLMKTYADLGADKRRLALGAIFGIWVLGIIAWSIYYSITVGGLLIKLRRTCYKGDWTSRAYFRRDCSKQWYFYKIYRFSGYTIFSRYI